jgi:hypothetical protein
MTLSVKIFIQTIERVWVQKNVLMQFYIILGLSERTLISVGRLWKFDSRIMCSFWKNGQIRLKEIQVISFSGMLLLSALIVRFLLLTKYINEENIYFSLSGKILWINIYMSLCSYIPSQPYYHFHILKVVIMCDEFPRMLFHNSKLSEKREF